MNETEFALYWCTENLLLPKDVPTETGLPDAECRRIVAEIERVRSLYVESMHRESGL